MRKDVEQISKAGERASVLTRQLLAFSRKQTLEPHQLNLNMVIADIEKMLHRLIGEDIELVTILAPDLGQVLIDPGQLEQIIMNLVINARDAMPEGGKLTLETANVNLDERYVHEHAEVQPGPYVMIAVSDTGIGMDKATSSRIFEPFFTTKTQGQGTGLGLATVYGIVKQSSGSIWVYSEPEHGATFKIYLPRLVEVAEPLEAKPTLPELSRGSETILIVEDEASVRDFIGTVLEVNGYTVLAAANGQEALALCQQHPQPIDLLLTDWIMPGINGHKLAEQLTRLRPNLKVLFISGYTGNTIIRQGIPEVGRTLLEKPFSPGQLVSKVREVLDGQ
jgi:CheY-like chemotaxis protein